jgi:hypothetical protein
MNRHDVRLLQQVRGYPCVTILMPTHRTAPANQQDPLRLKMLLDQATNRLLSEFSRRDIERLLGRLDQLAGSLDLRYVQDGLALFANQDIGRAVVLPFSVKERVMIDETFATRELVYALNHLARYWVLALSEKPTRLYEGVHTNLTEVTQEGFPMVHEGPGGAAPLPGGYGIRKSAHRDERHRQFFRQVDNALKPFLADDPLPLVLIGIGRYQAFFRELTAHASAIVGVVSGSHDRTPAHELAKLAWPLVEYNVAARRQEALGELQKAVSEKRFVATVGEVWRLAHEGRGALLLVEEGFHYPALLDESGTHLVPVDDPTTPGAMDDAVDEIVETVMDKRGNVVFLPNGQLADYQRIALILRY